VKRPDESPAVVFFGIGFWESLDLQFWTRIGTMNLAGAPDSDPARRKGISIEPHRSAALRFIESYLR